MVGTPQLPLKYRRKGVSDYWVFTQHQDMQFHHSAVSFDTYRPGSENSMPHSPTFYSSSSSIAPSSPIRSLYTPEPSSPILAEPHIASSPKSPRPNGRKGFWDVALNYCPDPSFRRKPVMHNTDYGDEQIVTRRRSSSSSAPTLVSDIEPSEYSEDYDPFHADDDATDEENPQGSITIVNSRDELAFTGPRFSHLPPDHIDTTNDSKSFVGEMDVAAVLLDLSRQVRVGSVEPKTEDVAIGHAIPPSISPVQRDRAGSVSDESSEGVQAASLTSPTTLENDVHSVSCDGAHDIKVSYLDEGETHGHSTNLEVAGGHSETSENVTDVQPTISVVEDGPCSTAKPETLHDACASNDQSPADVAMNSGDNRSVSSGQENICPTLGAESRTTDDDQKRGVDIFVETTFSDYSALTPISSPALTGSNLSELTEPLSGLSSPGFNVFGLTGPSNDTLQSREEDDLNMASRPSSPVPGPSNHQLGSVDQSDPRTKLNANQPQPRIKKDEHRKVSNVKPEETDQQQVDGTSKKKRARSKSTSGSRPSSPRPSASCSDLPRPRKKRSKRTAEDSSTSGHENDAAQSSSSSQSASATAMPAHCTPSSPSDPKVDMELPTAPADNDDATDVKAELHGCLIQAMALSRASSMPGSSLVREVLRENPHLSNQQSREELLRLALSILESHDVFGRVNREGLDADDKPLEAQWFYIPENDPDQERASLLREMMPKKRSTTKKHKQYFFKPLGKISRWDPEDAP